MSWKRPDLAQQNRKRAAPQRAAAEALLPYKKCTVCDEVKHSVAFGTHRAKWDGLQSRCRDCARQTNAISARTKLLLLREQAFDKLGRQCQGCGFSDVRALQFDHIHGDGHAREICKDGRRRTTVATYKRILSDKENSVQVLCANCNWIKRYTNNEHPKRKYDHAY